MMEKEELTLLGIWNILPLGNWVWFNDICVEHLRQITGIKLGVFFFVKGDLNYESFLKKDTDALKKIFDNLSHEEQLKYVQNITDDYYKYEPVLEKQLKGLESKDFTKLSNEGLALEIEKLGEVWSKVTMQIWYAVLLDIWYPSPKDKSDAKKIIAVARDRCGHLHKESDEIEKRMYVEAAKRLNISEREIYFMVHPEIIAGLRKGQMLTKDTIKSRIELCIETNYFGSTEIIDGERAGKTMARFNIPTIGPKKENVLKGTPASKGKVTARAHVILLDREFSDFKEGEILVSLQTMVHYLPIMKKASAILTEFGGLTSHAAIVSRELGKPAVVGISGLISTIKTGDKLEVDADKGIVRVIK